MGPEKVGQDSLFPNPLHRGAAAEARDYLSLEEATSQPGKLALKICLEESGAAPRGKSWSSQSGRPWTHTLLILINGISAKFHSSPSRSNLYTKWS